MRTTLAPLGVVSFFSGYHTPKRGTDVKDSRILLLAALCLNLIALTGCDRTQKREEAINRGEGPALIGARQCRLVHGKWLGDAQRR